MYEITPAHMSSLKNLYNQVNLTHSNFRICNAALSDFQSNITSEYSRIKNELQQANCEIKTLKAEISSQKCQLEKFQIQIQQEKTEKFEVQYTLSELQNLNVEQAEFFSEIQCTTCSLAWRLSQSEESVRTMLSGTEIEAYISITQHILEVYVDSLKVNENEQESNQNEFLIALCGIFTNIAASSTGREYMMQHEVGVNLLKVSCSSLSSLKNYPNSRLVNILLMGIYNMSINKNAYNLLLTMHCIVGSLLSILQDSKLSIIKINCLKLLRSLISGQKQVDFINKLKDNLSKELIQELMNHRDKEVSNAAKSLNSDLNFIENF